MADLADYLGHILCEVTRARVMADMEALRVAKEYAGDEAKLLRHFPVPRMRLPTLEITVPVQVNEIPDGYVEKTSADATLLAKVLADELGPALRTQNLHISISEITKIIAEDPQLSKGQLYEGLAASLSVKLYDHTKALARKKSAAVPGSEPSASETFKKISDEIRERTSVALASLPRQPMGISIESRTSVLREIGNPALLLNIKLTISEDALEILLDEDDAASQGENMETKSGPPRIKRLVPE